MPQARLSRLVYLLWMKSGAYPITNQVGSGLSRKHNTRLERAARDKHSSLVGSLQVKWKKSFVNTALVFEFKKSFLIIFEDLIKLACFNQDVTKIKLLSDQMAEGIFGYKLDHSIIK